MEDYSVMKMNEGYIKFNCVWTQGNVPDENLWFDSVNALRTRLYDQKLVGMYPNGIGYGNVSIRLPGGKGFIISGTATGGKNPLKVEDYSWVTDYAINQNRVECTGMVRASSESMSHAVIYDALPQVNCVIHIHQMEYWKTLLNNVPTTNKSIAFGTPELANAIAELCKQSVRPKGVIALAGHEEGIIAYGPDTSTAYNVLMNACRME
jgi:ribulose-5-phosphate 4-epimerase/fuculose-1-phosphate aldolase